MKRTITLTAIFLIFLNTSAYSQYISFQDTVFENELIKLGIDINSDGKIDTLESASITELDVSENSWDEPTFIKSLKGIENFKNLKKLICYNNQIDSIDLSKNIKIQELDCSSNQLVFLKFSENNIIKTLNITYNNFENYLFPNMSELERLFAGGNKFDSLSLDSFPKLQYLNLSYNQFSNTGKSFSLKNNEVIKEFNIEYSNIEKLDVSGSHLNTIWCRYNNLQNINISNTEFLKILNCQDNNLTHIDISTSDSLRQLGITNNNIDSLDLSHNNNLSAVNCDYNKLVKLDLPSTLMNHLNCSNNLLNKLDLTDTKIRNIYCGNNNIDSLNTSGDSELVLLDCVNNNMTSLLLDNPKLNYLYCSNNQYSTIALTYCSNLISAIIYEVPNLKKICVWSIPFEPADIQTDNPDVEISDCLTSSNFDNYSCDYDIFPNPFKDIINIKSDNPYRINIEVYNLLGEKVFSSLNIESSSGLGLSFLKDGVYLMKIIHEKQINIIRIVKNNLP